MALISTSPNYGFELIALFGVSKTLILEAKSYGVAIDQPSVGLFHVKHAGKVYGHVSIKGQAVTLVKENKLGPASKQAIQHQFETYLKAAVSGAISAGHTAAPVVSSATQFKDPIKSMFGAPKKPITPAKPFFEEKDFEDGTLLDKALALHKSQAIAKAQDLAKKSIFVPNDVPSTVKGTKLLNATEVYQPVAGTTAGSTYLVLALYPGLNVACRIKGMGPFKLSLRAEGTLLTTYSPSLLSFGMTMAAGYASGHYEVESHPTMLKALGAFMGQLGFDKAKAMADPSKVVAKFMDKEV